MRGRKNGEVPPRLLRAASRFAQWRRTHVVGTRIPESLWRLAADLAGAYGLCCTASMLRLDYYGLKKRVEAQASCASKPGPASVRDQMPAFVELAPTLPTPSECVIELENAAGWRMRVLLKGIHAPDLVALSGSFWSAQR